MYEQSPKFNYFYNDNDEAQSLLCEAVGTPWAPMSAMCSNSFFDLSLDASDMDAKTLKQ